MAANSERIGKAAKPAAEPTSLRPSGAAVGPIEGSNIEDGGGRVGNNASDFYGPADGISSVGDNDEVTNGVTGGVDRDDKGSTFEGDGDDKDNVF